MDRSDVSWRGYWAACPTPFREDESYDADAHRALLDWYVGEGLHGVLINGPTGEWFAQTPEERKLVAENAIDAVGGRIPVVIGCTAYTAREASDFVETYLKFLLRPAMEAFHISVKILSD